MNRKKLQKQNYLDFGEDLIESFPIGMMILDKNGRIIRMNKKQEEISQIRRVQVLGRTFEEAFPNTLEQGLKEHYFNLLKDGIQFDIIIDRYIPQYYSTPVTYHARGAPLSNKKYFILIHELEEELYYEKRRLEKKTKKLIEYKKFLESLIDSSPVIVISTDLTDRILVFNKAAQETFHYTEEDVRKKKTAFLFKDPLGNKEKERKNAHIMKEILCVRKNQSTFPGSLLVSGIKNTSGRVIAKLYLIRDLTEKKELEERVLFSEKLAMYTELMGGIAHQLNNPLIGVVNFSEMLLKEMKDQNPKRELVETISKAGQECLKIITSVLNSIKDPHLTFSEIDINKVLVDSLNSLKEQFGEKLDRLTIETEMNQKLLPVLGDEIQLKQCFLNIMINAIQVMQNGGNLKIETRYDEGKRSSKIMFSDTGPGIPNEFQNKIFMPFFSLQKFPGRHGLGLSFAYQIIKNHGGYINVESKVGKGSTFTIELPTG